MTIVGSFDMPGVPPSVAEATFADVLSAPKFVDHILEVKMIRGNPSEVGNCWREDRIFQGRRLVAIKHMILIDHDPHFTCQVSVEYEETPWFVPPTSQTFTFSIIPLPEETLNQSSSGDPAGASTSTSEPSSCRTAWKMGMVAHGGLFSQMVGSLTKSCLYRQAVRHVDDEIEMYYHEALRRKKQPL